MNSDYIFLYDAKVVQDRIHIASASDLNQFSFLLYCSIIASKKHNPGEATQANHEG